jgi:hypothetical protein
MILIFSLGASCNFGGTCIKLKYHFYAFLNYTDAVLCTVNGVKLCDLLFYREPKIETCCIAGRQASV